MKMTSSSFRISFLAPFFVVISLAGCASSEQTTNTSNQNAPSANQNSASKTGIPECDEALAYFDELEKEGHPLAETYRDQVKGRAQEASNKTSAAKADAGIACKGIADLFRKMKEEAEKKTR